MSFLISAPNKINFKQISESAIASLPSEMQGAAKLVAGWQSGKKTFELKTSGSTGIPKTIQLYRDKIEYSAHQTAQAFGINPGDTLLCCLGLNYVAGFMMVMRALVIGCNLVIEESVSNPLAAIPEYQNIDFASFVPLQIEAILNDERTLRKLKKLKTILLGGAPVNESLQIKLQEIRVPVYHSYAMTETYTHVAIRRLNGEKRSKYYYPMPGVLLSADSRGCLVIKSFVTDNNPLITNDLVELNPDGSFLWVGRYDNIINSGGIKIQIEKIETVCENIFVGMGISQAFFAAGLPDERLGQKLVIVVEDKQWGEKMINNFNDQLSARLGKYEVPKDILFVDSILKTATGKVDRNGTIGRLYL
jgi:o-succinylbenzoate---CoA ligase